MQATCPRFISEQQIQKEFFVDAEVRVNLAVATSSVLWQKNEILVDGVPSIFGCVIVRTMIFLALVL